MIRLFGIVAILISLGACASPQYNYQPEFVEVSFPALGEVTTVGVGDTMIKQGKFVERDSILLTDQVTVGAIGTYTLSPGYYSQVGFDKTSAFFLPEKSDQGGHVQRGALADPFEVVQVMNKDDTICGVSVFGGKACSSDVKIQRTKRPSLEADGFQQALIYSGKIGNRINIGYREFSNNYARPAFNNDVEYDLSESREIGYKGALLEILDADNRSVTYKVVRNFNAASN